MRTIIIIVSLLIGPGLLSAGKVNRNIKGKIIDEVTLTPLYGVNVSVADLESPLGTITNEAGEFLLWDIPDNGTTLAVSLSGYDSVKIKMPELEADSTILRRDNQLIIKLRPLPDPRKATTASKKDRN